MIAEREQSGLGLVAWALFSLRGRMRRISFFLGSLLLGCVFWFVVAQIVYAGPGTDREALWGGVFILVAGVSCWCLIAMAVKRLHDMGLTGWLALILLLPGFWMFAMPVLALWPGMDDDNKYGPPPVSSSR